MLDPGERGDGARRHLGETGVPDGQHAAFVPAGAAVGQHAAELGPAGTVGPADGDRQAGVDPAPQPVGGTPAAAPRRSCRRGRSAPSPCRGSSAAPAAARVRDAAGAGGSSGGTSVPPTCSRLTRGSSSAAPGPAPVPAPGCRRPSTVMPGRSWTAAPVRAAGPAGDLADVAAAVGGDVVVPFAAGLAARVQADGRGHPGGQRHGAVPGRRVGPLHPQDQLHGPDVLRGLLPVEERPGRRPDRASARTGRAQRAQYSIAGHPAP